MNLELLHLQIGDQEQDVIVPTAGSCGVAKERMEDKEILDCKDWFFCTKKLDEKEIYSKLIKD
jgi:peroxiredoxin (alkyl hydroperoxide reductase subunit C)